MFLQLAFSPLLQKTLINRSTCLLAVILFFTFGDTQAQTVSPYNLQLKRDLVITGIGAAATTIGVIRYTGTADVFLSQLRLEDVNGFDDVAIRYSSTKAKTASDFFFYGSTVVPATLMLDPAIREDAPAIGVMYAEVLLLTVGLTTVIKSTARRARPFVHEPGLSPETIVVANERGSFLSGHTSGSAAGLFFAAKVYSDYHPDDKSRFVVWTAAALIPAATGYLRVRAGRHFPTDVIAGYAIGAGIGVLVPALHKNLPKIKSDKLSITPLPNGLYASFTF
jgi:membrane-associated phospholipid phosphatase